MANNVGIKTGLDATVATDDAGGAHYQVVKLADGTEDSTSRLPGHATRGLKVDPYRDLQRIVVTPTVSNGVAYTAGDAVGGILQFANAARASGGTGEIKSILIYNKANSTLVTGQLVFFDRTFTHPGDNVAWNPSDTDALNVLGTVHVTEDGRVTTGVWTAGILTQVPRAGATAGQKNPLLPYVLNGTDLFAALVTNGTPTLTSTSDVQVAIIVERF